MYFCPYIHNYSFLDWRHVRTVCTILRTFQTLLWQLVASKQDSSPRLPHQDTEMISWKNSDLVKNRNTCCLMSPFAFILSKFLRDFKIVGRKYKGEHAKQNGNNDTNNNHSYHFWMFLVSHSDKQFCTVCCSPTLWGWSSHPDFIDDKSEA
jgi:hypothetical protein